MFSGEGAAVINILLTKISIIINCEKVKEEKRKALVAVLAADPRPSYQNDPEREYGMSFAEYEVKFKVDGKNLTVTSVNN